MNRHAARAQIESEEVDAVSVFITGDKDNSARNANIDDLTVFASAEKTKGSGRFKKGRGREGEGIRGHTVCGIPRLTEAFRQLDVDKLPKEIP